MLEKRSARARAYAASRHEFIPTAASFTSSTFVQSACRLCCYRHVARTAIGGTGRHACVRQRHNNTHGTVHDETMELKRTNI